MKKLVIVVLSVAMAFSLAACSGGNVADPTPTQGIAQDLLDMLEQTSMPTEVPVVTPTPDLLDPTAAPTASTAE